MKQGIEACNNRATFSAVVCTAYICVFAMGYHAGATTIVVRPSSRIDALKTTIENASDGDTIVLNAGVHRSSRVSISKRLCITGGRNAIVTAEGRGPIFLVGANGVSMRGFTLRETGNSYIEDRAAIKCLNVSGCRFEDLAIERCSFGVYFGKSRRGIVRRCLIAGAAVNESNSGNGIHSWYSDSLLIENNVVMNHRDGIYLEFTRHTLVRGNTSIGNLRYGLHFMFSDDDVYEQNRFMRNGAGVAVMYTRRVDMRANEFLDNWGPSSYGLLLKDIYDSNIHDNVFERNTAAIYAEGGARLTITRNVFQRNGWAVRLMANCTDNVFTANVFESNTFDVATNSTRNNSVFRENFWDAYRGYDLNRDGFGDTPFRPVRIFSHIVERNPPAIILLNSFFISLLDITERVFPSVTPATLVDERPLLHPPANMAKTRIAGMEPE